MDRQDIDALLIGALYGELTPADEARLTAHLDSHPGDRGALDDLKNARQAVHDSRIFAVQLDPPQSVSALLLQEAHRRAPRPSDGEGWFARFVRTFMAHPAMAAAAMLVVVVGVAGTLYMRNGTGTFAEKSGPAPTVTITTAGTAPVAPRVDSEASGGQPAGWGSAAIAVGSSYEVGLDDNTRAMAKQDDAETLHKEQPKPEPARHATSKKGGEKYLEVQTDEPVPKDFPDRGKAKVAKNDGFSYGRDDARRPAPGGAAATGGGAASSAGDVTASGPAKTAPPPQPAAQGQAAEPSPVAPPAVDKSIQRPTEPRPEAKKPAPDPDAQVKQQHAQAVQLAQKGDCAGAAKLAVVIKNTAPAYYTQYVANDRNLKGCKAYVDNESEKDSDKAAKARSPKRSLDEPTTVK